MKVSTQVPFPPVAPEGRGTDTIDGGEFAALLAGFAVPTHVPPPSVTGPGEVAPPPSAADAGVIGALPGDLAATFAPTNAAALAALAGAAADQAPVASPPVASPPVASPPVASPPVASPAVASPPVASPAVASPPVTGSAMSTASPSAGPEIAVIDLTVAPADAPASPTPLPLDDAGPTAAAHATAPSAPATDAHQPLIDAAGEPAASATGEAPDAASGTTTAVRSTATPTSAAPAPPVPLAEAVIEKPSVAESATPDVDGGPAKDVASTTNAAVAVTAPAGGSQPVEGSPKLVIAPGRVDTVAVAAARASAESTRPIRLSVRLDPPNLGEIRIELTARGNQVTMRLEPTAEIAGPALQQQRAAVAEALERSGFQLAGFDVANPEQQKQGYAPQPTGRRDAGPEAEEPTEATAATAVTDALRI